MPAAPSDNAQFVMNVLTKSVAVLEQFPAGYLPIDDRPAGFGASSFERAMADTAVTKKLQDLIASWPAGLYTHFVETSSILSQFLIMYGWHPGRIDPMQVFAAGVPDPDTLNMMMALPSLMQARGDGPVPGDETAAMAPDMPGAILTELERRAARRSTPFGKLIGTLLGPDAPRWLNRESTKGMPNLQPHEMSRHHWPRLEGIGNQMEIEQELFRHGAASEEGAKSVVGLCWSMVAMASFMEPAVFLVERDSHVSSLRPGQFTISHGLGTHALLTFDPTAMVAMTKIVARALGNNDITACDLMWMANGLARRRSVAAGTGARAVAPRSTTYDIFLSHRGTDAKRDLAQTLLAGQARREVFLDCLTLPHGLINRAFVYGSLARSRSVVVVDTPLFRQSPWCRKELWLAEEMANLGAAVLRRVSLSEALAQLPSGTEPANASVVTDDEMTYPIAHRVLRDIDNDMRGPNKATLVKATADVSCFAQIEAFLANRDGERPDDGVPAATECIALLRRVSASHGERVDIALWATALQYAVAALGGRACARSKMDVRRGIDQLTASVRRLVADKLYEMPAFAKNPAAYLAVVAGAAVLDLAGFRIDERTHAAIAGAVKGAAVLRNGLLLLDVRSPGPRRDLHLKLLLLLIENNIGGAGIVQTAADPVHELTVGDTSLAVLPCVTLHPGMEPLYPDLDAPDASSAAPASSRSWIGRLIGR